MNLEKFLILHMLFIDDEPMNLIIEQANINQHTKEFLRQEFWRESISSNRINGALYDLLKEKMIIMLNTSGNIVKQSTIRDELPENIWFRITPYGKMSFKECYHSYSSAEPSF